MSRHTIELNWVSGEKPTHVDTYTRNHNVVMNGPQSIKVSASTQFKGDPSCADPEQMLVSALASCHMLTFLAVAEVKGFLVERYEDVAVGFLEKSANNKLAIARIELHPSVYFHGDRQPDEDDLERLHESAHKNCFIANSVNASVEVKAVPVQANALI